MSTVKASQPAGVYTLLVSVVAYFLTFYYSLTKCHQKMMMALNVGNAKLNKHLMPLISQDFHSVLLFGIWFWILKKRNHQDVQTATEPTKPQTRKLFWFLTLELTGYQRPVDLLHSKHFLRFKWSRKFSFLLSQLSERTWECRVLCGNGIQIAAKNEIRSFNYKRL